MFSFIINFPQTIRQSLPQVFNDIYNLNEEKYRWDIQICAIVMHSNLPIETKKKMLQLLLTSGAVITKASLDYIIDNESVELLKFIACNSDWGTFNH